MLLLSGSGNIPGLHHRWVGVRLTNSPHHHVGKAMSKRPFKKPKIRVTSSVSDPVQNDLKSIKQKTLSESQPINKVPKASSNHDRNVSSSDSLKFQVIAGSYDKILYGLQVQPGEDSKSLQMKPIFIFPAHISCVKAVAASPRGGKWLATGGTDEAIKIWDLKRRRELGTLQQHSGMVPLLF